MLRSLQRQSQGRRRVWVLHCLFRPCDRGPVPSWSLAPPCDVGMALHLPHGVVADMERVCHRSPVQAWPQGARRE